MSELLDTSSTKQEKTCRSNKKYVSKSLDYAPLSYELSRPFLSEPLWGSRSTTKERETMVVNYTNSLDTINEIETKVVNYSLNTTESITRNKDSHGSVGHLQPLFEAGDTAIEKGTRKSVFIDPHVPSLSENNRNIVTEDEFKLQDLIKQPRAAADEKTRGGVVSKTVVLFKKEEEKKSARVEFVRDSRTDMLRKWFKDPKMTDLFNSEKISSDPSLTHVSSFNDYGEPLVSQNVVIDFTPIDGEDERGYVVDKCAEFWNFIRDHEEIHHLEVMPEPVSATTTTVEEKSKGPSPKKGLKSDKSSSLDSRSLLPGIKALKEFGETKAKDNNLFHEVLPISLTTHCKVVSPAYEEYFEEKHWHGQVQKKDNDNRQRRVSKASTCRLSSASTARLMTDSQDKLMQMMIEMDEFDKKYPKSMVPMLTTLAKNMKFEPNKADKQTQRDDAEELFKCVECNDADGFQFSPLEDEPRVRSSTT